jgi:hypothetical protein
VKPKGSHPGCGKPASCQHRKEDPRSWREPYLEAVAAIALDCLPMLKAALSQSVTEIQFKSSSFEYFVLFAVSSSATPLSVI